MFGMGNGWLIVAGLCSDIAGFLLLAWDLMPEYRMMPVWRRIHDFHRSVFHAESAISHLKSGVAIGGHVRHDLEVTTAQIRNFIDDGTLKRIDAIGNERSQGWHGIVFKPIKVPEFDGENFAEWLNQVDRLAEAARSNLAARKRPSIPVAVGLIFMGFSLQAWGSIPVSPAPIKAPAMLKVDADRPVLITVEKSGAVSLVWSD